MSATIALASVLLALQPGPAAAQAPHPGGADGSVLSVKLADGRDVRIRDGRLTEADGRPLAALQAALEAAPEPGAAPELRRLFSLPPAGLDRLRAEAAVRGGPSPALGSWLRVRLDPTVDVDGVLARLNARPEVDTAYRAPLPAPPPGVVGSPAEGAASVGGPGIARTPTPGSATGRTPGSDTPAPDLTPRQTYFGPAPRGIDAAFARTLRGGDGSGVRIVDIESDWVLDHEDLALSESIRLDGSAACAAGSGACFPDHGTSVLGVLRARDNGFGVTGGVPAAQVRVLSPRAEGSYDPADALARAGASTEPGDVILVELQAYGPSGDDRYLPLEWIPEVYDAILALTRAGRVVVEPAGNGGQDLDEPAFGGRFERARFHSGAIVVGAGDSNRVALPLSNHGSRVDLQGWGCCVTTTGAGDDGLSRGILARSYRHDFGGTSSAAAMVAAAAAALQGAARKGRGTVLSGPQVAAVLRETGTPQAGGAAARPIGPLPDLRRAISRFTTFETLISEEDAVRELLRGDRLTESHRRHLDLLGNADGVFDAGDVAALLDRRRAAREAP